MTTLTTAQRLKARASLKEHGVTADKIRTIRNDEHLLDVLWQHDVELATELVQVQAPTPAPQAPTPTQEDAPQAPQKAPESSPAPSPVPNDPQALNALTAALSALMPQQQAPAVDEATLIRLIQEHATQTLEVVHADKSEPVKITGAHKALKPLVIMLQTKALVYLQGPAGSGKTTLAAQAAESLGLDFYAHGSILAPYEVLGTLDAHGTYHETQLYKAFKHGGVVLFDEIDGCSARAIIAINRLIERGCKRFTFPNGETVEKHPDFLVIAAANTAGTGATRDYAGRVVLDGASLDRFIFLTVDYDTALEKRLARAEYARFGGECDQTLTAWVDTVLDYRKAAKKVGCNQIISPRASISGAALLAAGMDIDAITEAVVIKGMPQDMRKQLHKELTA